MTLKEVKSKTGETELQTPEYAPPGPVRTSRQDDPDERLVARIATLESQVKSLQIAIGTVEKQAPIPGLAKAKP